MTNLKHHRQIHTTSNRRHLSTVSQHSLQFRSRRHITAWCYDINAFVREFGNHIGCRLRTSSGARRNNKVFCASVGHPSDNGPPNATKASSD
jgi:hypothetical protein